MHDKDDRRSCAAYDKTLHLEAYYLQGSDQPFPSHFHDYYVLGLIESGTRRLSCCHEKYDLRAGHIVLFHPGEAHGCLRRDEGELNYRALNLSQNVMLDLAEKVTGRRVLPGFSQNVIADELAVQAMRTLHQRVMQGGDTLAKEESAMLLFSRLIGQYGQPFSQNTSACREEVERACRFLKENFAGHIALEDICRVAGLSKSTLLRAFPKAKGVTPYRYLETVRVGAAKQLLEQGVAPADAALRTGFSDQSHLTHVFRRFIGLGPGMYRAIFGNSHYHNEGEEHGA